MRNFMIFEEIKGENARKSTQSRFSQFLKLPDFYNPISNHRIQQIKRIECVTDCVFENPHTIGLIVVITDLKSSIYYMDKIASYTPNGRYDNDWLYTNGVIRISFKNKRVQNDLSDYCLLQCEIEILLNKYNF